MAGPPTPMARKLGVVEGGEVLLVAPPPGWTVAGLPPGVTVRSVSNPADAGPTDGVVVAFVRRAADLPGTLGPLAPAVHPTGMLWLAWPRRAGGHASDLTDVVVRDAALPHGIVDTKVAALDDDWSGLRFVWRRELRSRPPGTP